MFRRIAIFVSTVMFAAHAAPAQQTPAPQLEPVTNCQIIARINDQVVLACEVVWEANVVIAENRDQIPPDEVDKVRQMLMRNYLAGLIDVKLLYADFKRVTAGRADMESIKANLVTPFEEGEIPRLMKMTGVERPEDLPAKLAQLGTSLADRRTAFMERAIAGEWIKQSTSFEKATHADMLRRYEANIAEYDNPAQARWEELVVMFSSHATRDDAQRAIAQLGNQVWPAYQANPNSPEPIFADAAKGGSEGFTAAEGGLRDWTTAGALRDQHIDNALFALPVGAMSPIMESNLGFHIVRVIERKPAGRTPFADVQDDLRKEIEGERRGEATEEFIKRLRRNARVWTVFTGDTTAQAYLDAASRPARR